MWEQPVTQGLRFLPLTREMRLEFLMLGFRLARPQLRRTFRDWPNGWKITRSLSRSHCFSNKQAFRNSCRKLSFQTPLRHRSISMCSFLYSPGAENTAVTTLHFLETPLCCKLSPPRSPETLLILSPVPNRAPQSLKSSLCPAPSGLTSHSILGYHSKSHPLGEYLLVSNPQIHTSSQSHIPDLLVHMLISSPGHFH